MTYDEKVYLTLGEVADELHKSADPFLSDAQKDFIKAKCFEVLNMKMDAAETTPKS